MGEAACLRRSFSHPSESCLKAEQGDPVRVLGESISFGRFMSESLAWEKWSSFSQNRYLEEVEKFSKPGLVAQKKAYFEAHYKKKALQREENFVEEPENKSSPSEFTKEYSGDIVGDDTTLEINISDVELVSSIDANVGDSPVDQNLGESSESKEVEEAAILQTKITENKTSPSQFTRENSGDIVDEDTTLETNIADAELVSTIDANVGDSPVDNNLGESFESKEVEAAAILQTKNTEDDEAAMEFSEGRNEISESGGEERRLSSKKRLAVSSPKLDSQIGASKLLPNPAKKANLRPRQMNNALSKSMKPADNVLEKARLPVTAKSLHSSINFPSGLRKSNNTASASSSTIKRRLSISSQKSRPQIGAPSKLPPVPTAKKTASLLPRQTINPFSKISKPVLEKLRLPATAKSLHLSINCPFVSTTSSKATSFSQSAAGIGLQKTPLKAASEIGMSEKPPANTRPIGRRILSQSVSSLDMKLKSSARLSTGIGNKVRSATVSSSFNFRIEERALKRKEFFQKLEEKAMEKKELQTRYKNKTAPDKERRWQSTRVMAKQSENLQRRTPFSSNHERKVVKNGFESCNLSQVAKEPMQSYAYNGSYPLPPRRPTTKSDRLRDSSEKKIKRQG